MLLRYRENISHSNKVSQGDLNESEGSDAHDGCGLPHGTVRFTSSGGSHVFGVERRCYLKKKLTVCLRLAT